MRALRPLLLAALLAALWLALRGPEMRAAFEAFRLPSRLVALGEAWPLRWPQSATPANAAPAAASPRRPPPPAPRTARGPAPPPLSVPPPPLALMAPPEPAADAPGGIAVGPAADLPDPSAPVGGPPAPRRWSLSLWSLVRDDGPTGPSAAPLLGGGQSGLTAELAPDPARLPLAAIARLTAPHRGMAAGAQVAIGLRWRPAPGVALDAERLLPIGDGARAAWTLRASGGVATAEVETVRLDAAAYGEAGIVGARRRDLYAAGLAHAGLSAPVAPGVDLGGGAGVWGSIQHTGGGAVGRLDVGPTLRARLRAGPTTVRVALDYRVRVAGGAAPGSGPALTVSTGF